MPTLVCKERKWIFIHAPRTGGTSVSSALRKLFSGPAVPKHRRLSELDLDPSEYFKFMTVRNPWERIASTVSWYEANGEFGGMDRAVKYSLPLEEYGLDEMDFVLQCSHLAQDFGKLCERLGIEMPGLKKLGAYPRKAHWDYFDLAWSRVVEKRYAYEIKRFGYEF